VTLEAAIGQNRQNVVPIAHAILDPLHIPGASYKDASRQKQHVTAATHFVPL
jgi:hypothetical protein